MLLIHVIDMIQNSAHSAEIILDLTSNLTVSRNDTDEQTLLSLLNVLRPETSEGRDAICAMNFPEASRRQLTALVISDKYYRDTLIDLFEYKHFSERGALSEKSVLSHWSGKGKAIGTVSP